MAKRGRVARTPRKRIKVEVKEDVEEGKLENEKKDVKEESGLELETSVKAETERDLTPSTDIELAEDKKDVASNIFKEAQPGEGPDGWWKIYNEVARMRAKITTPVDTQGCERMPESICPGIRKFDPKRYRFQLLVSLMLSSQTKDEVTFATMKILNDYYHIYGGLCIEGILATDERQLDTLIGKVGFHNRKSVYIKKTCEILLERYDGDVPKTIEAIVGLPGIGPKMGYLLLQNAWRINLGIGVDVHLHRLAQMWGWAPKSNNPEQTRAALEKWLPQEYWADVNPLIVGFGQVVCVPRASNCDICLLSNGLCKGRNRKLKPPISEERRSKLMKQRGDLSALIEEANNW